MKYSALLLLVCLTGCARFTTIQTDESYDIESPDQPIRKITTKAQANTLCASKSALANWKAQQTDKTQGASVGSLTQEATNPVDIGTILGSALKSAIK